MLGEGPFVKLLMSALMLTALRPLFSPPMFTNITTSPKCNRPSFVAVRSTYKREHHLYHHYNIIVVIYGVLNELNSTYRSQRVLFEEVYFLDSELTPLLFLQMLLQCILEKHQHVGESGVR